MININEQDGSNVAIIEEDGIVIVTAQDALDLMATAFHTLGCNKLLIPKENICREFFDLKTGIAGEILQKFSNYGIKLAIVGDFSNVESKSLRDFIYECNNGSQVFFLPGQDEALERLHKLG